MSAGKRTDQLNASRALDHLRSAVRYADRGHDPFFDPGVPDTFLLVESELRKAYESLNRLGQSFFIANPKSDRGRIGEVRQLLTHDYSDVEREVVWHLVRDEVPNLLHLIARAKFPRVE